MAGGLGGAVLDDVAPVGPVVVAELVAEPVRDVGAGDEPLVGGCDDGTALDETGGAVELDGAGSCGTDGLVERVGSGRIRK
jgi:hypothetical protein